MSNDRTAFPIGVLLSFVLVYAAASLLHHVHNAEFLADYPNMPTWLSRAWVYAAWCGVTAIGAAGVVLLRLHYRLAGLLALSAYAALGLDGLGHYAAAPMSSHTWMMNFGILLEVTTALLLLSVTAVCLLRVRAARD